MAAMLPPQHGGGIDRAQRGRVLHVQLLAHVDGRDLGAPAVVELVRQVCVQGLVAVVLAVPVGAQEGGARQADVGARGVARQARDEGPTLHALDAGAHADLRVGRQPVVQRAVQRGVLAVHVVDEGVLVLSVQHGAAAQRAVLVEGAAGIDLRAIAVPGAGLGHDADAWLGQGALAHQVDGAAGVAAALHQARGAAQHFHAVIDDRAACVVAGAAVQALHGNAVVLHARHVQAARIDVLAALRALQQRDARGAGQGLVDRGDVLLPHQLVGDHADGLGRVLERLLALADAHGPRRIGARAFGGRAAQCLRGHVDLAQRQRAGRGPGCGLEREAAAALRGHGHARAAQQLLQRLAWREPALDGLGAAPGQIGLVEQHLLPGLLAERTQRRGQRLGRNVERQLLRTRLLCRYLRLRWNRQRHRCHRAGHQQRHGALACRAHLCSRLVVARLRRQSLAPQGPSQLSCPLHV